MFSGLMAAIFKRKMKTGYASWQNCMRILFWEYIYRIWLFSDVRIIWF